MFVLSFVVIGIVVIGIVVIIVTVIIIIIDVVVFVFVFVISMELADLFPTTLLTLRPDWPWRNSSAYP